MQELRGTSLLAVMAGVVLVLYISKGALTMVAAMPLISQALQLMGIVYLAELLLEAYGQRPQRASLKWPAAWTPSFLTQPAATQTPDPTPPPRA